jgi:carbonic anhydrase
MTTTHKHFHQIIATSLLTLLLLSFTVQAHNDSVAALSPEAALEKLKTGNERFVKGLSLEKHYLADRPHLAEAQHPYAIILTCADSRLSPEAIFDESLGQLFVIRVAGNVSDPIVLGSIEYAAEHLGASLLVVLGHESCGAVKAAVANSPVPPNITKIVQRLRPAVEKARVYSRDETELLNASIKENVRYQVKMMTFESDVLSELTHEHKLKIMGGVYNLHSGKVEFLSDREAEFHPPVAAEKKSMSTKMATHARTALPVNMHANQGSNKPVPTPVHVVPVKKATPVVKETSHSTHDDDELSRVQPSLDASPAVRAEVALADKIRSAYENSYQVTLRRTAMLRDSRDRCLYTDCRSLPAGAIVTLDSPHVLDVMGIPNVRVRSGKQAFYVRAEEANFVFSTDVQSAKSSTIGQVLSVPTKLMTAFSVAAKQ